MRNLLTSGVLAIAIPIIVGFTLGRKFVFYLQALLISCIYTLDKSKIQPHHFPGWTEG